MKELLFLAHRIPYPPNKGDKIRSFNLLKYLSGRYRVHLGAFIDDPDDWRHVGAVKEYCAETRFISLRPVRAKLRSLSALLTGEPLTLPYYRDGVLRDWVNNIIHRGGIERIFVFSSAMGQYVPDDLPPGTRCVLDFVDMDSDKWRQYSLDRPWPAGMLYRRESKRLLACERRLALRFDASLFVSRAEAELFTRTAPETATRVSHIDNGVDTDYFSPDRGYPDPYPAGERALVFTGAMDYRANADAVAWFAREVFPAIHARCPDARFYIVGARPVKAVRRLAALPGVRVTGAVKDIRPYLAHAVAAVAPMRIARGVQNKVLEAMSMARPVLLTPQARDGIRPCPGVEPLITGSPEKMAELALGLLSGEGRETFSGDHGRECVRRDYDWGMNLGRLQDILEGKRGGRVDGVRAMRESPPDTVAGGSPV